MSAQERVPLEELATAKEQKYLLSTGWVKEGRRGLTPQTQVCAAHVAQVVLDRFVVDDEAQLTGDLEDRGAGRRSATARELREAIAPEIRTAEVYDRLFGVIVRGTSSRSTLNKLFNRPNQDPPLWYLKATVDVILGDQSELPAPEVVFAATRDAELFAQWVLQTDAATFKRQVSRHFITLAEQVQRFPEMADRILAEIPRSQALVTRYAGGLMHEMSVAPEQLALAAGPLIEADLAADEQEKVQEAQRELARAEKAEAAVQERLRKARDRVAAAAPTVAA